MSKTGTYLRIKDKTLPDLDQNIRFIDLTIEVLNGFTREEVLGVPFRDVLRSNLCHQEAPASMSRGKQPGGYCSLGECTHDGD